MRQPGEAATDGETAQVMIDKTVGTTAKARGRRGQLIHGRIRIHDLDWLRIQFVAVIEGICLKFKRARVDRETSVV